jgi:putative ABC transport system substrate-binding protein
MKTRSVIVVLLILALAVPATMLAQNSKGGAGMVLSAERAPFQIGYVGYSTPTSESADVEALRHGLRDLGYIEGKDIVVDYRGSEGSYEKTNEIIAELVRRNVDIILTFGTPATLAAKKATSTIPIVVGGIGDPVYSGVVESLSRPGGNVTGLSDQELEIPGKWLELLHEVIPGCNRVAVLLNFRNPLTAPSLEAARSVAEAHRIQLEVLEARTSDELESAFAAMAKAKPDGLMILREAPFFLTQIDNMVRLASGLRIPVIYPWSSAVRAGGLMSYETRHRNRFNSLASYIDKILKGAKPGELPFEVPTEFRLTVNMKTARTQGIEIPRSILSRADRIIE